MSPPSLTRIARIILMLLVLVSLAGAAGALTPEEELGKALFYDTDLSNPAGQSCSACHGAQVGYTGPDSAINAAGAVYEGAVAGRFGNRKPPSAAYAGMSPVLHLDGTTWVGGMFWDGRATGQVLGDPLAEQAEGPFLNPLEQNLPSADAAVNIVKVSSYAGLFEQVWGPGSLDNPGQAYAQIGRSIAAYERSGEVSPFSSRYDAYLAGKAILTPQELQGLQLFNNEAGCSACHVSSGSYPVFTDYTYDNIGVPRNPLNPFYTEPDFNPLGEAWVDQGLGGFLEAAGYPDSVYNPAMGKMKVPTLRNVDKRPSADFIKAYSHNGFFKSLGEIVHFYNTRDVLPQCDPVEPGSIPGVTCWPAPEVAENVNHAELGNLGLSADEEAAVVAFLETLTDGSFIDVTKFYDANANGVMDAGEQAVSGWKYTVDGETYFTPDEAVVDPGLYTVTEKMPVQASWKSTTPTERKVTVRTLGQTIDVEFGNLCLGPGGGLGLGFWSNKNGEKLVGPDDLFLLRTLNLKDAAGNDFDPTDYRSFKNWLLKADAKNMAYMLSAQLAAMELNVRHGKVSPDALIYAPGTLSATPLGYATVVAVMYEADGELGAHGYTPAGNTFRSYQEALKNALDRANGNQNFVQSKPCAFSFA